MRPPDAAKVKALGIPGVDTLREYRRYYPAGEVTGHLLGFTNVDDVGQEGLELAFDQWLGGEPGAKRVMRDSLGRTIEDIERIRARRARAGPAHQHRPAHAVPGLPRAEGGDAGNTARAGSMVVLDIATGEVLAMVNQPAFNPNDREQYLPSRYRNRATNDFFEPGSSIKPFVVAAGDGDRALPRRHADRHQPGHDARRHQDGEGPQQPRHDRRDDGAREVEQRRHGEDRADAQAAADVDAR